MCDRKAIVYKCTRRAVAVFLLLVLVTGCGKISETKDAKTGSETTYDDKLPATVEIAGLTFVEEEPISYASGFRVYKYEDGYRLIAVLDGSKWLVVPEGAGVPKDIPADIVVIKRPLKDIYLAGSAVMSLFVSLDAIDTISFSSLRAKDWYVDEAVQAMQEGKITFAGKYDRPDYEKLLASGCPLAVESTMILHTPEVREKLQSLGIPVFTDYSSNESEPLGRTEWIKCYGALLGKEDEAKAYFTAQEEKVHKVEDEVAKEGTTHPTVAFFYINSAGNVVTRVSGDYIPRMIESAGGSYIFDELHQPNKESRSGSITISLEEFCDKAKEADFLFYNATIDAPIADIDELVEKNEVFSDFKAVKEGKVCVVDGDLYQATDRTADIIEQMHWVLRGEKGGEFIKVL